MVRTKQPTKPATKIPTLAECEKVADWAGTWKNRCMEIAILLNHKLELNWFERYGLYWGDVEECSIFDHERAFHRHGWLELPDGRVFDPTRWVFDSPTLPYIFCAIPVDDEYDAGAHRLRKLMTGDRPVPKYDATQKQIRLVVPGPAGEWLQELFANAPVLSLGQLFYLANLPPDVLGKYAEPIYEALHRAKQQAKIPLDNWVAVMQNGRY